MTKAPTPMMDQYLEIKAETGTESVLAYRMGDFYEFFFADAQTVATALQMTLTTRGKHEGKPLPMCGFPVHSAERHLQALVSAGLAVAVCEVIEGEGAFKKRTKGMSGQLPRREVMRLISPPRDIGDFIDPANLPRLGDYVGG